MFFLCRKCNLLRQAKCELPYAAQKQRINLFEVIDSVKSLQSLSACLIFLCQEKVSSFMWRLKKKGFILLPDLAVNRFHVKANHQIKKARSPLCPYYGLLV